MWNDLVLDVSVVIAAVSPTEVRHSESLRFLQTVHRHRFSLEVPAHFLLELYAVLARSPRELRQLGFMTEENPVALRLKTIGEAEVQEILAWVSSELPGKSPARGADLAYVWVARKSGLPLVSLDEGMHTFTSAGVNVYYPGDLLKIWGSSMSTQAERHRI
jgi:predicted nucleic acid-binding protein